MAPSANKQIICKWGEPPEHKQRTTLQRSSTYMTSQRKSQRSANSFWTFQLKQPACKAAHNDLLNQAFDKSQAIYSLVRLTGFAQSSKETLRMSTLADNTVTRMSGPVKVPSCSATHLWTEWRLEKVLLLLLGKRVSFVYNGSGFCLSILSSQFGWGAFTQQANNSIFDMKE